MMGSLYLKKSLRDLEAISPRKLLNRRTHAADHDAFLDSQTAKFEGSANFFRRFLPYNNLDSDDDGGDENDPYSADHFRMYEFKVRRCTRSRSHDWTDCPFAHPGEKARRRDPRKFHYSGAVCSEFRKGSCSRGDNCEFAHGVFECWLHPARYRTEPCKDGRNCKRKVCFFAHSPKQLRIIPVSRREKVSPEKSFRGGGGVCCLSPTSTLMGIPHMSPPLSPSLSPPVSPFCRCGGAAKIDPIGMMSYNEALSELVSSLEAMNVMQMAGNISPALTPVSVNRSLNMNIPPPPPPLSVDVSVDPLQFGLSPTTAPGRLEISPPWSGVGDGGDGKYNGDGGIDGIDLGWVNDLLT